MVDLHETNNPERRPQVDTVGWLFLAFACCVLPAFSLEIKKSRNQDASKPDAMMANANGHGGKRAGAGRPSTVPHPTHGGKREGAGRTPGVSENISPARLLSPGQKWAFVMARRRQQNQMVTDAASGKSPAELFS